MTELNLHLRGISFHNTSIEQLGAEQRRFIEVFSQIFHPNNKARPFEDLDKNTTLAHLETISSPESVAFAINNDEQPPRMVGTAVISKLSNYQGWLDYFVIDEDYRSKGVGKKALDLVIKTFDIDDPDGYISLYPVNEASARFYERSGFQGMDSPYGVDIMSRGLGLQF